MKKPRKQLSEKSRAVVRRAKAEDEGPQSTVWTGNSGGAEMGGMIGSGDGLSRDLSMGGCADPTKGASEATREAIEAHGEVGGSDSSADLRDTITRKERSGAAGKEALTNSLGQGDGPRRSGLPAPSNEKIRKLQRTLYRKAKAEPNYRFYSLYGEICRVDVLAEAFAQVKANRGSGGVDGVVVKDIAKDEATRRQWLEELREELIAKRYKASAVKRVLIPKSNGKTRAIGIPTIKDRVVQTAAVIVLSAIFEADFHPRSYGFRPKRSAHQAIEEVKEGLYSGRTEVIDADLEAYFDAIPHRQLMRLVIKRVSDASVIKLIKAWLRAPIQGEGKSNKQGTPQGGVISPLLANLYLNDLDHGVNECTGGRARMVRFADDFVILCPVGQSAEILQRVRRWLERRGIRINEEKSRTLDSRKEGFNFLGFGITWRKTKVGKPYVHIEPNVKSRKNLRESITDQLNPRTLTTAVADKVSRVNHILRGWTSYFRHWHSSPVLWKLQDWVCERMRGWLWRKQSRRGAKYRFTKDRLFDQYGLYRMIDKMRQT